jgi:SAM-dependent methyltransferase
MFESWKAQKTLNSVAKPIEEKVEIENFIKEKAQAIAEQIQEAASSARNETEFRISVSKIIDKFATQSNLKLEAREEYTLIYGRADSVYSRLIIEYKKPKTLKKALDALPNRKAVAKIQDYFRGLQKKEKQKMGRLAGVILDGSFIIFVRYIEKGWQVDPPLPISKDSTERFLRYLSSLALELPLTPERLVEHFGEDTSVSQACVGNFYKILTDTDNPKVKVLFEQWQTQFHEICGYKEDSPKFDIEKLASAYGILDKGINPFKLFFSIHSYYATFIKLFAIQVASFYAAPRLGTGLKQVANYSSTELLKYLREMERGGVFKNFGINNFLEGDFFGWYLDVWNDKLDESIRRVVSKLADFSLITLAVDPEETRDLLKKLYQNLMPKELRHNLGEYYTPDWLAERLLNQLDGGEFRGDPDKRLLDPACGSGTFLVLAIRKIKQYCNGHLIPEYQILEKILENVVGFDLNPLAIISARTNYLLALGDLIAHRKGEINLPVYLCDSISTPNQKVIEGKKSTNQLSLPERAFSFKTAVGDFSVPQSLVSAQYIDSLANLLEECVDAKLNISEFRKRLVQTFPLDENRDKDDIEIIEQLFNRLAQLNSEGVNGIWARIIKNAFAPIFQTRFDYVAGNPPWVNWENLPDEYRQRTAHLWTKHNLFMHRGLKARLGGAKDDISILMLYIAMDNYLKDNGKLGFVITQTVFKTKGGGAGFRQFRLGSGTPLKVLSVDDMSDLKPFEGAANRTSVVIMQKGRKTTYPVSYSFWRKKSKRTAIPLGASLSEVIKLTKRSQWIATPVKEGQRTGPWITGRPKALDGVSKCVGKSNYRARAGTCGWANGIYWLHIIAKRPDKLLVISNLSELAKRKVENIEAVIEPEFVYPLLRGENVQRWKGVTEHYILAPQNQEQPSKAYPEKKLKADYFHTWSYLKKFEEILRMRSGYRKYFSSKRDPFYSIYNVGEYTFKPYKVVWREQASVLTCAVVGKKEGKMVIPDHKLMFCAFNNLEETHFVCACLNSSPSQFIVKSYSIETSISTHVLDYVRIPRFDKENSIHVNLAHLSRQAHAKAGKDDIDALLKIERQIDALAAELWSLSKTQLKDIQDSLEDLID